ncbi:SGNH/GDSL hydrolase family protein [Arthrobacter pityocampae]|uniref:SGNH/GDSL hydrolase family protein n=1 Tax=Arthrobacter pityocampae TaxID=547334 RepID=A0A2S5IVJ6_9MICC|nr:SGNH/GDSL hydrolase family protein [Arthrobacter pityocampae]PPB48593.1 SGNH/GDSL hydrolase family protein [Arthrobacter pityocampae]
MTIPRLRSAAAALALLAAVVVPAQPAAAAPASYVALGDSYSSGTGTRVYLADGTTCQRSVHAFPALIASAKGYALDFRACSGATVADVAAAQLGALTPSTSFVSVSVGGNDAAFAAVLTECAKPAWMSNCTAAIDRAQAVITGQLPGRLGSLYGQIRARAPQASVTVAGYPRIFNGEDCNAATWFSPTEEARLNATADLLNRTTGAAATAAGFTFRDPTTAFTGHAVCDDVEWLNGLASPVSDSYHPNRSGHAVGYVPLIGPALTGAPVAVTTATVQAAELSAPALARDQRAHAAQDARIVPERFVLPDLTSAAAQAAAARAGVDLSDAPSIARADRAAGALQESRR